MNEWVRDIFSRSLTHFPFGDKSLKCVCIVYVWVEYKHVSHIFTNFTNPFICVGLYYDYLNQLPYIFSTIAFLRFQPKFPIAISLMVLSLWLCFTWTMFGIFFLFSRKMVFRFNLFNDTNILLSKTLMLLKSYKHVICCLEAKSIPLNIRLFRFLLVVSILTNYEAI